MKRIPKYLLIEQQKLKRGFDKVKKLSQVYKFILIERYGLEDGKIKSLQEVGQKFGMNSEKIQQKEAKALMAFECL